MIVLFLVGEDNEFGELGDGSNISSNILVPVLLKEGFDSDNDEVFDQSDS